MAILYKGSIEHGLPLDMRSSLLSAMLLSPQIPFYQVMFWITLGVNCHNLGSQKADSEMELEMGKKYWGVTPVKGIGHK